MNKIEYFSGWEADFTNDPSNDYELIIEISYKNEDVGIIKKGNNGLELVLFACAKNIVISLDWLSALVKELGNKHEIK